MRILLIVSMALLSLASVAADVVPVDKVKVSINVRQQPDTSSEVVGRLKQGASLPLVSKIDGWYEVQLEGDATGFVSADWAQIAAATTEDGLPEDTAEVDVEVAAASPAGQTVGEIVDQALNEGMAQEDAVAEAEEVAEEVAEVEEVAEEVPEEIVEEVAEVEVVEAVEVPVVEPPEAVEVEIVKEAPAVVETQVITGPAGPAGPPGPPGAASIKGSQNFLVKFKKETEGGNSQIFDDGNQVGIGTTDPKQRLEVNGSIQIHEQNSSVAGLMITQSSGETGYIMHNRASTLTIGAGSQDRVTIDRDGNVGIGVSRPAHPLQMVSGAHVTSGGVWTNSSSREKKENISSISAEQAMTVLAGLDPVRFNYRDERHEEYVGFIAEDVPELVANQDRQTLSTMDIVAVLTKVVQAQQQKIEELEARLDVAGQ